MSVYVPKELHVEDDEHGWWVCDQFGRFDGPYKTEDDAYAVAQRDIDECPVREIPGGAR
jgi:hypothetical protein